ncbi:MAG: hypothetical protein CM15mP116_08570 [Synechococcus sp.]|nr:MAG: hypothetical protein CM15mP116_08570 [Synechococcus sp.]
MRFQTLSNALIQQASADGLSKQSAAEQSNAGHGISWFCSPVSAHAQPFVGLQAETPMGLALDVIDGQLLPFWRIPAGLQQQAPFAVSPPRHAVGKDKVVGRLDDHLELIALVEKLLRWRSMRLR